MWIEVKAEPGFTQDFGESASSLKDAKAWVKTLKKQKVQERGVHRINVVEIYDNRILESWDWSSLDGKWERATWNENVRARYAARKLY